MHGDGCVVAHGGGEDEGVAAAVGGRVGGEVEVVEEGALVEAFGLGARGDGGAGRDRVGGGGEGERCEGDEGACEDHGFFFLLFFFFLFFGVRGVVEDCFGGLRRGCVPK